MKNKMKTMKFKKMTLAPFLFLVFALLNITSCENDETQTVANLTNVTLAQEFDVDGAIDPMVWSYDIGNGAEQGIPGWGNNELQYYTNREENIRIEDGVLKITAIQEQFEGAGYTSARIVTKDKFEQKYGRFEARMKLPWGQGYWPAFWLLGSNIDEVAWPNCGEIDIMENRGQEPTLINGTVHGPGYSGGNSITKAYELDGDRFDTGFHVFGIEWGENFINYYVDGDLYNQITPADVTGDWVFDQEFYIILNLAVGGNYVGPPNANTEFPQTLEIDYVRVYQ